MHTIHCPLKPNKKLDYVPEAPLQEIATFNKRVAIITDESGSRPIISVVPLFTELNCFLTHELQQPDTTPPTSVWVVLFLLLPSFFRRWPFVDGSFLPVCDQLISYFAFLAAVRWKRASYLRQAMARSHKCPAKPGSGEAIIGVPSRRRHRRPSLDELVFKLRVQVEPETDHYCRLFT